MTVPRRTHGLMLPSKPTERRTPRVTPLSLTGSGRERRAVWVHRRVPCDGGRWDRLRTCQGTRPEGQLCAAHRVFLGASGCVKK